MTSSSLPHEDQTESTKTDHFHIVFLPGLHGTAELFSALNSAISKLLEVSFLSEVSFSHSLITYPTHIDQSYASLKNWLSQELPLHAGDRKIIIIAESFSSPLALMLAIDYQAQIHSMVLGAGFCANPVNPILAFIPLTPVFLIKPPRTAVRHFLVDSESADELVNQVRNTVSKTPANILSQRLNSVFTLEESFTSHSRSFDINTPILLLQAQNDALIPWKAQNLLEQHLPHATVRWVNSPHLIFQSHPDICAQHIVTFLKSML